MMIFAIDPGSTQSAYCMMGEDALPIAFDKVPNLDIVALLRNYGKSRPVVVIERVASYGMPVGREVFDTCEWIGRYTQVAKDLALDVEYILRQEEKLHICKSPKANDATIRKALIDRFAKHDFKTGKGNSHNPDFFYNFRADIWAAFSVGVVYLCKLNKLTI